MIWFTSDTHFGHENIIRYANRPYENVTDMNLSLIKAWNSVVKPQDTVYHLGDIAMGTSKSPESLKHIIDTLHGEKIFILGNHDNKKVLSDIGIKTYPLYEMSHQKQKIVLCHYAMRIWHHSHKGTWHLYGHSHNGLESVPYGKSMDVGVDAVAARGLGYRPISFDEVKLIMDARSITVIDHHNDTTT